MDEREDESNAMRETERQLVEIVSRAYRVLDDDEVSMLCWGLGIDSRLVMKPLTIRRG